MHWFEGKSALNFSGVVLVCCWIFHGYGETLRTVNPSEHTDCLVVQNRQKKSNAAVRTVWSPPCMLTVSALHSLQNEVCFSSKHCDCLSSGIIEKRCSSSSFTEDIVFLWWHASFILYQNISWHLLVTRRCEGRRETCYAGRKMKHVLDVTGIKEKKTLFTCFASSPCVALATFPRRETQRLCTLWSFVMSSRCV